MQHHTHETTHPKQTQDGITALLIVLLVDFIENVLETTIIRLEDRILGRHVQRHVPDGVHASKEACELLIYGAVQIKPKQARHKKRIPLKGILET